MVRHVAVVSQTARISISELAVVSAAVQKQVVRDFAPIWGVEATVQAFASLADTPSDYCPVVVRDDIGVPGAAGVHRGVNNQLYALVQYGNDWPAAVSHEVLELLVDPTLDRLIAGPSIKPGQGRVSFLIEVCDPCQADRYEVNGVKVSDFCTPAYFAPLATSGVQYNFSGTITQPRQIRPGGYLSWLVEETAEWWLGFPRNGGVSFIRTAPPNASTSLREFIDGESDRLVGRPRQSKRAGPVVGEAVRQAACARAARIETEIQKVVTARRGLPAYRRTKPTKLPPTPRAG
jgi:hypothetical protein